MLCLSLRHILPSISFLDLCISYYITIIYFPGTNIPPESLVIKVKLLGGVRTLEYGDKEPSDCIEEKIKIFFIIDELSFSLLSDFCMTKHNSEFTNAITFITVCVFV